MRASPTDIKRYRSDIDGLRAIAVLLVVAFHLDLSLSPPLPAWLAHSLHLQARLLTVRPTGGFVGVDVFFVISGFLISGILLRERANGTFSIVKFYERRVRRIAPALVGILAFTCAVAWVAYFPSQLRDFARSVLAATLSVSNIYFWRFSGYFDPPSLSEPLLHTWSLSVEEQFYVFFPLVLLALRTRPRKVLVWVLCLLAMLSFAASIVLLRHHESGVFYLPITRAWELLTGTILALEILPLPQSRLSRNLTSAAGLALILWAAFHYTGKTTFPGPAALAPCLGAALVLAAGTTGDSIASRLLSTPPFVFFGLISYSLYLWHWPLLLINRYEYFPWLHLSKLALLLLIIAAATLSWRFIEQPFRDGRFKLPRRRIFIAAGASAACLTIFGVWAIASNGIPSRYPSDLVRVDHYLDQGPHEVQWGNGCFASIYQFALDPTCLTLSGDQPNFLLFGDSQTAQLWYGLKAVDPEIHLLEATASQCPPLPSSYSSSFPFCRHLVEQIFDHFLPAHHVDAIVISSIWTPEEVDVMGSTVKRFHDADLRVYVVGPIVVYDQPLPILLMKAARTGDAAVPARHRTLSNAEYSQLDEHLAAAAMKNGAYRYISLRELLCPGGECLQYVAPGVPLQFDQRHLTNEGSLLVALELRERHLLP